MPHLKLLLRQLILHISNRTIYANNNISLTNLGPWMPLLSKMAQIRSEPPLDHKRKMNQTLLTLRLERLSKAEMRFYPTSDLNATV